MAIPVLRENYQLTNLWDFTIFDLAGDLDDLADGQSDRVNERTIDSTRLSLRIRSGSLPFPKLSYEERSTGGKTITGVEFPGDFSIEVYETVNFSTYNYFRNWLDRIYDMKRRQFRVLADENEKYKVGYLSFENYTGITSILNLGTGQLGSLFRPLDTIGQVVEVGSNTSFGTSGRISKAFRYDNLQIKGLGEISYDYGTSEAMVYSIDLTCDMVDFDDGAEQDSDLPGAGFLNFQQTLGT